MTLSGWSVTWDEWRLPVEIAVATAASGVVAWLVGRVVRRLGRRHDALAVTHDEVSRAWIATVMSVVLVSTVADRPGVAVPVVRVAGLLVVAASCWLVVRGLFAAEKVIVARLRVDVADNLRMRRARTQVVLLRRIGVAVVVIVGLAAGLISFPSLRTFGASLLASAGLAGVVAGLAAQTMLANVIAGLQLAFTDALRVDDVVVAEGEWGRVEDITLTYVVLHLWDERRLVLPTSWFTTTPFENWTRTYSRVLGSVILHLDYLTPVEALREKAREVIEASPLWDRRDWVVQVTDTTETTMVVRVLASAYDAPTAWDLRCDIREELLTWLREKYPQSLPVQRVSVAGPGPT